MDQFSPSIGFASNYRSKSVTDLLLISIHVGGQISSDCKPVSMRKIAMISLKNDPLCTFYAQVVLKMHIE